jgi:hypothetical protein
MQKKADDEMQVMSIASQVDVPKNRRSKRNKLPKRVCNIIASDKTKKQQK